MIPTVILAKVLSSLALVGLALTGVENVQVSVLPFSIFSGGNLGLTHGLVWSARAHVAGRRCSSWTRSTW